MADTRAPPTVDGLPIVGNAYAFARDPVTAMEQWAARGGLVRLRIPGESMYLLTDPELIEQVLVEKHERFSIGPAQRDSFEGVEDHAITTTTGERWQRLRNALRPAFARDALDRYTDRFGPTTASFVERWDAGADVDLHHEMRRLTVQLLADALLGVDASGDEAAVMAASDALVDRADFGRPGQLLPDWVPTPTDRRFESSVAALDDYVTEILDSKHPDIDGDDVCTRLLATREAGMLSEQEVRHNVVGLLLAGHESPGLALTYAWYLLSGHPEVTASLRAEYDEVVDGQIPDGTAYDSLTRTRNVVREALRLYPPTMGINRQTLDPVTLGSYDLPAGAQVLIPQWIPHRDERYWDAPEQFDPDRWDRATDRPEYAYFPFSGGPRYCIGMEFARVELTLALATMVGHVDLDVAVDEPLSFRPTIALRPEQTMSATVHPRG